MKTFTLLGADGVPTRAPRRACSAATPHARLRAHGLPGRAEPAATRVQPRHRVFFKDESVAIAAGYRPCGACLREKYRGSAQAHGSAVAPRTIMSARADPNVVRRRRAAVSPPRARRSSWASRSARAPARSVRRPRPPPPRAARPTPGASPTRDAGAATPSTPVASAAGRQARRAALPRHHGPEPTCARSCTTAGPRGDPVRGEHRLPAAAARADGDAAHVGPRGRRDADRLHRPGGRRDPQRELGAAGASRGGAGARAGTPKPPRSP